jgi:hypothetical protein
MDTPELKKLMPNLLGDPGKAVTASDEEDENSV